MIHHMDENKMNYSPDNLMAFPTSAGHIAYHNNHMNMKEIYRIMTVMEQMLSERVESAREQDNVKRMTIKRKRTICADAVDIQEVVKRVGMTAYHIQSMLELYTYGIYSVIDEDGCFIDETNKFPLFFMWWEYNFQFKNYTEAVDPEERRYPYVIPWSEADRPARPSDLMYATA